MSTRNGHRTMHAAAPAAETRMEKQVTGLIQVGGDLRADECQALVAVAGHDLTLTNGGGALFVAGNDFTLTNGGAGIIATRGDLALTNGGCGVLVAGGDVTLATSGAQGDGSTGLVIARSVTLEGKAAVIVEITPERVAGAIVGLALFLPMVIWRRLRR